MESHDKVLALSMALAIILMGGMLVLVIRDQKITQVRYERCVEAGMQWNKGSCLK